MHDHEGARARVPARACHDSAFLPMFECLSFSFSASLLQMAFGSLLRHQTAG
jgi:hypothetical protein